MIEIKCFASSYEESKYDFIPFKNANRDLKRNECYFDWRYLEKPIKLKPVIVWAENRDGQKIGSVSVTPHLYRNDQAIYWLGILGDISVTKEWRGKGVTEQMLNYLIKTEEVKSLKAFIVMPNGSAARPLQKAGWQQVLKLERYVKLLNIEEKIKPWNRSNWLFKPISTLLNYFLRLLSAETVLRHTERYKGEIVSVFDERFDDLWNRSNEKGVMIGLRNKEYLRWRYTNHPTDEFFIFTLSDNVGLCGYIIFRLDDKRCHVHDLFFLSEKNVGTYLIFHFLKFLKRNKMASSISIRISPNVLSRWFLYKFGFFKCSDYLNFMVKANKEMENLGLFQKHDIWFLTVGDKEV